MIFRFKPKHFRWSEVRLDFHEPSSVELTHKASGEVFWGARRDRPLKRNLKTAIQSLDNYMGELTKDGKA